MNFKEVMDRNYELEHELDKELCERYESLISFKRGRDFNVEIRGYINDFVNEFKEYLTDENEEQMNERLIQYNKLVVELKSNILNSVKIPSVMICGASNYPGARKQKEMERTSSLEAELYSTTGKRQRFIDNTEKMFNPYFIEDRLNVEKMRKERSQENGWSSFYQELDQEEIVGYGIDEEASRIYVKLDDRPSPETKARLKKMALRWSPKNQRWQRILTQNAINSIKRELNID